MAAFDFPASPTVGQIYTANGVSYRWDGQAWVGGPATIPTPMPFCTAHRSGAGNFALTLGATWYKLPLTTLLHNVGGFTLVSGSIQPPVAGYYLIGHSAIVTTAAASTGGYLSGAGVNGTLAPFSSGRQEHPVAQVTNGTPSNVKPVLLVATDKLDLLAYSSMTGTNVLDSAGETFLWAQLLAAT